MIYIPVSPMYARDQSRFQLKVGRFGELKIDLNEYEDRKFSEVQALG